MLKYNILVCKRTIADNEESKKSACDTYVLRHFNFRVEKGLISIFCN